MYIHLGWESLCSSAAPLCYLHCRYYKWSALTVQTHSYTIDLQGIFYTVHLVA